MIAADHPDVYIAVDIGGTTIKAITVGGNGRILARRVEPTFGHASTALASVLSVLDDVLGDARRAGHRPQAMGVCAPGTVDAERGVVTFAANLGWQDLSLASTLSSRYALPVRVDHDARAAASAEFRGRGAFPNSDVLFVPLGTGVSAAVISAGTLARGATGSAGELGHVIVRPGGEPCLCGQSGCVEAYAGATSILRRYRAGGGTAESVQEIAEGIPDDDLAATVWNDAVDALAHGLHGAIAVLDPGLIVLGGGLSQAGDVLVGALRARLQELLTWRPVPEIAVSVLASFGGIIGATLLVADHFAEDEIRTLIHDLADEHTSLPVQPSVDGGSIGTRTPTRR
ncbi:ROK family protein [Compostimonas suwonensis]|uniref:Glucokinase n=1 Tax=Compostimonas suwonensis TaxID=1048394 RepID=A0A2M9C0F2_9MICO|nr:ROK family protein [Compostimonas suwonensis]PJJ63827.1 glucokinase [Compostimonas suwonensis]